jgi:hypothetical protein
MARASTAAKAGRRAGAVDPELVLLPQPPRRARTVAIAVMGAVALAAASLGWSLRGEVGYALGATEPLELDAPPGPNDARFATASGRYVRLHVSLDEARALRLSRFGSGDERVAPAREAPGVWVAYVVPDGMPAARFSPPALVAGRLVPLDRAGPRWRGLASAIERSAGGPVAHGWLLMDGWDPSAASWLVGLEIMLVVFAAWNVYGIARVLRRAK